MSLTECNSPMRTPVLGLSRILLSSLRLCFTASASTTALYVAPDGSDANAGTKAKPFATLERARTEVRRRKQADKISHRGFTVFLRGGDFTRTNAFELTATDSGTAEAPVLWRAYRNEKPRLLGGRKLTGFSVISDPAVRARLDKAALPHVLQLDLRVIGLTNFGEMHSRGFGRPLTPAHCELFFDGKPMTLARWPNEGSWEKIADFPETSAQNDGHSGKIGRLETGFFYSGDRPRAWKESTDIWVHGYWAWDWANSYERVTLLDPEQRLIKTAAPCGNYGFRKGQRFYFLNLLDELDQPGEWFLDRDLGKLYFWPPQTAHKADPEILLSLLAEPLLKLTGVSNVAFQGLVLEATRGNAVEIGGGLSNRIAGCLIRNIGNSGVTIKGGTGHGVVSCDIFDTGDGGVSLSGGDRRTLVPGGHYVDNCHLAGQGRWSKCYVPAVLIDGVGMRGWHNMIPDPRY